jgi:hypothetical protein
VSNMILQRLSSSQSFVANFPAFMSELGTWAYNTILQSSIVVQCDTPSSIRSKPPFVGICRTRYISNEGIWER